MATTAPEQLNLKVKSQVLCSHSGWRGSVFQDQKHHPAQEADGRLLPAPERIPCLMQLNSSNVRFLFDGERLHETQTPKDLNMENGDEIDVVIEQVGGTR